MGKPRPGASLAASAVVASGVAEKLWSEATLAEYLDIQPATLRQWRWLGRGPRWIKVGGRIRYADEDVRAWLGSQKSGVA